MGRVKKKKGRKVRLGQMKFKRPATKDDLRITKILEDNKLSRFQTTTSEVGMYIDLKDALKVELLQVMNALQDKGYVLIKTPEKNVFNIVKLS